MTTSRRWRQVASKPIRFCPRCGSFAERLGAHPVTSTRYISIIDLCLRPGCRHITPIA